MPKDSCEISLNTDSKWFLFSLYSLDKLRRGTFNGYVEQIIRISNDHWLIRDSDWTTNNSIIIFLVLTKHFEFNQ